MRRLIFSLSVCLLMIPGPLAAAVQAGAKNAFKGLWISTKFPSISVPTDEPVTVDLQVHNMGLPPQRVALHINGVPDKWHAAFIGDGHPVNAAFVAPNSETDLTLRLTPPKKVAADKLHLEVAAIGNGNRFELPLDLKVGDAMPAKLSLSTELPALKGTPDSSFEYELSLKNDSERTSLAKLEAIAPPGFSVSIKEQYGSKELTSIPIKAGEKRDIKVTVTPPELADAGNYDVTVRASTAQTSAQAKLTLDISGQPRILLKGKGDRLSGDAQAGTETPINFVLQNDGTATAKNVKLSASEPSGWKLTFSPKKVDALPAGKRRVVKAFITPSPQAIAGDYMVTVSANGDGVSKSADYRVTVRTSTLWGIVGVLVIAAALVVLVGAVFRFGRR